VSSCVNDNIEFCLLIGVFHKQQVFGSSENLSLLKPSQFYWNPSAPSLSCLKQNTALVFPALGPLILVACALALRQLLLSVLC
jgi:hypothetical protein